MSVCRSEASLASASAPKRQPCSERAQAAPDDLRHDVYRRVSPGEAAPSGTADRHCRVDVGAGDVAEGAGDDQQRDPEGQRDGERAIRRAGGRAAKARGDGNRGAGEHQDEGPDDFRGGGSRHVGADFAAEEPGFG